MKSRLSIIVLSAAIAVGCSSALRAKNATPGTDESSVLVETLPAAMHPIARRLIAYGHVQVDPSSQSTIVTPRDGTVGRIDVRVGQRVSKGTSIVKLITSPTARMQYEQTKSQLEFARKDLGRLQRLMTEKLATTEQVASAENTLKQAESAFATQQQLGTGQESETIAAAFNGIVIKLLVGPGDHLAAGGTVAVLANEKSLLVTLGIEPEEASAVKPGQRVELRSPFLPTLTTMGTIDGVYALTDPTTRLVDAVVRLDAAEGRDLTIGMAIEGAILLRETNSIAVPRSAVLHDDKGDYIFIVKGSTAYRTTVTAGDQQNGLVAIQGDVKEGDAVVVTGNYELKDGMKTRTEP